MLGATRVFKTTLRPVGSARVPFITVERKSITPFTDYQRRFLQNLRAL